MFGVSSDEYLNYAVKNRKEWELQGQEVVAQMSAKFLPALLEEEGEEASLEDGGVMDVSLADCDNADTSHRRESDRMQFSDVE